MVKPSVIYYLHSNFVTQNKPTHGIHNFKNLWFYVKPTVIYCYILQLLRIICLTMAQGATFNCAYFDLNRDALAFTIIILRLFNY